MGPETISVVCTSDFAAFRTLSECKRLGIRIRRAPQLLPPDVAADNATAG